MDSMNQGNGVLYFIAQPYVFLKEPQRRGLLAGFVMIRNLVFVRSTYL